MFENYVNAKQAKPMTWPVVLLGLAVVVHAVFFVGLIIRSFLVIEKLPAPKTEVAIAMAMSAPPPPPPPAGATKKETPKEKKPRKIKVTETVQPVKPDEKEPEPEIEETNQGEVGGQEGGVAGGVAGGIVGGSLDGVLGAGTPPPPPPPKPAAVQNVAPTALEASRISGEKNILPDDNTRTEIMRSGKTKIIVTTKVCIDTSGGISSVSVLKASGFPAYDEKIKREIRKWKYRPFSIDGKATPACSAVNFIYSQR